eukprot:TRINITY_DN2662_c0_g1_i3.p1 TRINITY_DN2662_c0_g1~~TRINITY_DN2662_c0_g1_i3.p1  ORF type:complete len:782 (+),score=127.26 TRINITY_DN2662_c0_g1_i3:86-2431(+)
MEPRKWITKIFPWISVILGFIGLFMSVVDGGGKFNTYDREKLREYREEVREMFTHAYDSYLNHAYPYDELRPLTCDGVDTWGSYSLTLIDALDTLAVMGNHTEFARVYQIVSERKNFDANINVSVFETNIRIVGGLISAHLMAKRAGVELEDGWPCSGPLLRLAEDAADRLLPAFNTATGMPYGTVNLRHGVPEGETPVTCTAGVGTFIVEFGALSRLTGNPVYEETALRALKSIWSTRSSLDLLGNHIDVQKGRWTAVEAGIGAGVDSFYEYLVKGSSLLRRPELRAMFNQARKAVDTYLRKDDWHFWVAMKNGQVTLPLFQSLEAFWPGMLSMTGDIENALKSLHNYHQVWKQFGFTPEFYNVAQGGASAGREGYPLRPELIESIMYLYRATGDPWLVDAGVDILKSIQYSAYTPCGYATVRNAKTHTLDNRMESFFLAETVKYLYLLFDPDNFIHNTGTTATIHTNKNGRCVLDAGGYIFNTEAHPIDPAALACCYDMSEKEIREEINSHMIDLLHPATVNKFRGELIPEKLRKMQKKKLDEKEDLAKREQEELKQKLLQLKKEMLALEQQEQAEQQEAENKSAKSQTEQGNSGAMNSSQEDVANENESDSTSEDSLIKASNGLTLETSTEYYGNRGELDDSSDSEENLESDSQFPNFIPNKEPAGTTQEKEELGPSLQKFSSGDYSTTSGIVQPETMPNVFPAPSNKIVETLNNLLERFSSPKNYKFDMTEYTQALMADERFGLNASWYTDYSVLTCPGTKYTDRFLIHGEFFSEDP